MATIDVLLSGLMIVCLESDPYCFRNEVEGFPNTAWVINADGKRKPCGWNAKERTELELRILVGVGTVTTNGGCSETCKKVEDPSGSGIFYLRCPLEKCKKICVDPNIKTDLEMRKNLKHLPRISDLDERWVGLRTDRLLSPKYVDTSIHFEHGKIGSDGVWKNDGPIKWESTRGHWSARELADTMNVRYTLVKHVDLTDCAGDWVYRIRPTGAALDVEIRNIVPPPIPKARKNGDYWEIPYLLWYLDLLSWEAASACPDYTKKNGAGVLRCDNLAKGDCYYYMQGSTVYWPAMRGPLP